MTEKQIHGAKRQTERMDSVPIIPAYRRMPEHGSNAIHAIYGEATQIPTSLSCQGNRNLPGNQRHRVSA